MSGKQPVCVGGRGEFCLQAGCYVYVGSAQRSFKARFCHYLKPIVKLHWHIDYLLSSARLSCVVLGATRMKLECRLATRLGKRLKVVLGFGSSDCRCPGHLFIAANREVARKAVCDALESLNLEPFTIESNLLKPFLGL